MLSSLVSNLFLAALLSGTPEASFQDSSSLTIKQTNQLRKDATTAAGFYALAETSERKAIAARLKQEKCEKELQTLRSGVIPGVAYKFPSRFDTLKTLIERHQQAHQYWNAVATFYRAEAKRLESV
ncbi:hypothetical protein [Bryobacter aggregatus]|uniref:hypothetical protein n=1 Tax=Bryobacter aggregatus TaxID=360054 RepID=UPI0004E1D41B|nr:hypothetical protein [Bryobacter aggregatus]